ncbi:hypothetical protein V6N12_056938 [Hibiscus sabdariffa]|uniref:Uncharacterized protein n=1 Tax=Hibiscus sabdariffa TaxID=183260 RepID=A0ABR2DCJ0_9ROSI
MTSLAKASAFMLHILEKLCNNTPFSNMMLRISRTKDKHIGGLVTKFKTQFTTFELSLSTIALALKIQFGRNKALRPNSTTSSSVNIGDPEPIDSEKVIKHLPSQPLRIPPIPPFNPFDIMTSSTFNFRKQRGWAFHTDLKADFDKKHTLSTMGGSIVTRHIFNGNTSTLVLPFEAHRERIIVAHPTSRCQTLAHCNSAITSTRLQRE